MSYLILGLLLFFGVHLIPSQPTWRAPLVQRLGEIGYKVAFSLVSFAGLALIVFGMSRAARIAMWQPPPVASVVTAIAMLPVFVLLVASNLQCHIKRIVRHPMSLGILIWALAHILANGEVASLLLFASFAAYALYNMRGGAGGAAADAPVYWKGDAIAVVVGLVLYVVFAASHGVLFGVAVF